MERVFATPSGKVSRTATQSEILAFAKAGDSEAMVEIFKQRYAAADTVDKKLDLIYKLLIRTL